jgi:poly-gamma-glutamate capsule biosynthesis protein CapA/YwtB (metallophosphatase superfamily)
MLLWSIAAAALGGTLEGGVAALRSGRTSEALSLLQQAVDEDGANGEAWWELGWAFWIAGDPAGAARAWRRVEALGTDTLGIATPLPAEEVSLWRVAAETRGRWLGWQGTPAPVEVEPDDGARLRLVAAGDTMMGSDLRGPQGLPAGDGDGLFDEVRDLFTAADVAFLNLEGPLADGLASDKCGPESPVCYAFRTPTRFAGALQRAGVDIVQLANNHASDLGPAGLASTMQALDAVGIAHTGRYGDQGVVERGGLKIALVAAHSGSCCLSVNALDEVRAAVALADEQADLVVFGFHGGAEGSAHRHVTGEVEIAWGERRGNVRELAHTAIDAGADLVVGTGPHVLRGMEVYRGRLVAYSLGNFVGYRQFGTRGGYSAATVVLDATLAPNGALVAARLHPMTLDAEAVPRRGGPGLDHVRELSAADLGEGAVKVAPDGTLSW